MMALSIAHFGALVANLLMGFLVSMRNIRRATNQYFLLLSLVAGLWLAFLAIGFASRDASLMRVCIQGATATAITAPLVFNCMRLSIIHPTENAWHILLRSKGWLLVTLAVAWLCNTPFFLRDVIIPPPDAPGHLIPEPVHGPGIHVYALTFTVFVFLLMYYFIRDIRRTKGIHRTELQFITMGSVIGLVIGVFVAVLLPLLTGSSQTVQFSFLSILVLDAVIAYGIATRRIMEAGHVLRLAVAHALAVLYLSTLYAAVFFLVGAIAAFYGIDHHAPAHLVAAIAVAFSLSPARGRMQRFSELLFFRSSPPPDVGNMLKRAEKLRQSVTSLDHLLKDFGALMKEVMKTDDITVLMRDGQAFRRCYPSDGDSSGRLSLMPDDPVVEALTRDSEPLIQDLMLRIRPHPRITLLRERLETLHAAAAIGIDSKVGLQGVVLLGARKRGRIYGLPEQQAMQLLCNQMAVSMENAKLFTALQDSTIYIETLLDQLVGGVVAADASGRISVFNREAQRMTRRRPEQVLNQPLRCLPPALADLMEEVLRHREAVHDRDLVLEHSRGAGTPVRAGCSMFRGHTGEVLGVLLVFNDQTTVRKLEEQVRRTDRLASLGTLAAGMAHEIKNPLVSLKTFTDLLPTRYEDEDFRRTFTSLAGHEVKRIDGIVNQLLHFARPSPPELRLTHLHEVLTRALNLVSERLRQHDICWETDWGAATDLIMGDGDLLEQAFLNLFLNALAAMESGGLLKVRTANEASGPPSACVGKAAPSVRHAVRVRVTDTGTGIAPEDLPHVFDPFFTTRDNGSGLGLSVCHGIIEEHGAHIEVQSTVGRGTTFQVVFPATGKEATQ